jgi:hypothetical protein
LSVRAERCETTKTFALALDQIEDSLPASRDLGESR